jgi:hypothetical protein
MTVAALVCRRKATIIASFSIDSALSSTWHGLLIDAISLASARRLS